jgi:hypothetical protein
LGVCCAILLGAIFPSFSVILASLINIAMAIENSTDPVEKATLTHDSHVKSILLFVFSFLNLVMIISKEFCFLEIG